MRDQGSGYSDGFMDGHEAGRLAGAKEERERDKWIPISERLPQGIDGNRWGKVLLLYSDWSINCQYWNLVGKLINHVAWQPLPSPPKQQTTQ